MSGTSRAPTQAMAEAPLRKEDATPLPVSQDESPHNAFNFFQGCQSTPRPDWGQNIIKFSMPGPSTPVSKKGATRKIIKFPGRYLG